MTKKMKKHKLMAIAIATATACMSFMSCSDNNQDPAESSVELSYTLPASLNGATVSNASHRLYLASDATITSSDHVFP